MTDRPDLAPTGVDPAASGGVGLAGNALGFLRILVAGARLALMLPVRRESFRLNAHHVVLLLMCTIGIEAAVQFIDTPPRRQINLYGLTRETAYYAVVLFAAYCVVALQRAPSSLSWFAGAVVATFPTLAMVWWAVDSLAYPMLPMPAGYYALYGVAIAWPLLIGFRAIRMIHGAGVVRALLLASGFTVIISAPAFAVPQIPIWSSLGPAVAAADGAVDEPRRIDVEDTYYRQARLLDGAYKSLHRHRPGVADLYFVGFGGYARQDVFLREVESVRALFDERFDTAGRSVLLVNNPATVRDVPLASATNLQRVLGEVARRMNVDEDILFLFLTSHGSRDHRLSTDFWPLQLNDLAAESLADYLDQSGIKWRVVVVSACYSGGFIDSLADENSLIITAARRDRRSFGCSHENEWTYFGQAYFDEQLRTEYSFTAAFRAALETIAAREQTEELTPSEPQIHVGAAIAERLEALRVRIEADDASRRTN